MASVHGRAARAAGARVQGVLSSNVESSHRASVALGVDRAYADLDELLSDPDVDVVHICTPNATHAPYARAIIEAGKHVVCEKPLATTVEDATSLVDLVSRAGVVATVPFVYRYHPMVREARERIARGDSGRLFTFTGSYHQDWLLDPEDDDWRADSIVGGPSRAFADIGSHLCDLLEFVAGDRIARLAARTRTVFPRRGGREVTNEDAVALVAETVSGAIGTLSVSQLVAGRKNHLAIEIAGSEERVQFDQEEPDMLWLGRRAGDVLLRRDPAFLSPDSARLSVVPAGHPMGYQEAFAGFAADTYASVRGEHPDGVPTFVDGRRAAILTDAVLRSAASQTWIQTAEYSGVNQPVYSAAKEGM